MTDVAKFFLYGFYLVLFVLFLVFIANNPYTITHLKFINFNKDQEQILQDTKNTKLLLSYRHKEPIGLKYVYSCYVNFYQLTPNFDVQKLLSQYQITTIDEIKDIKGRYVDVNGNTLLECLNKVNNGSNDDMIAPYFSYYRGFLVRGSTKNTHLMTMNASFDDVEIYIHNSNQNLNDTHQLRAFLFDKKRNIIKMVLIYGGD